jgi:hypothetical protein
VRKCGNPGAALCWVVTSVGDESARLADRRSDGSGAGDNRWQRFSKSIVVARQRALSLGGGKVEAALATVATKTGERLHMRMRFHSPTSLFNLPCITRKRVQES